MKINYSSSQFIVPHLHLSCSKQRIFRIMTRFTYMVVRKGRLYTPACRLAHQRFKIKVSKKHFVRSWFLGWVSRISHTQGLQVDGSPATEGPVYAAQSSPTPRLGTNTHTHTHTHTCTSRTGPTTCVLRRPRCPG